MLEQEQSVDLEVKVGTAAVLGSLFLTRSPTDFCKIHLEFVTQVRVWCLGAIIKPWDLFRIFQNSHKKEL